MLGTRSGHEPSPLGDGRAVGGSGWKGVTVSLHGCTQVVKENKVRGEGARIFITECGMGMLVHVCAACLPSLFAMGDP